MKTAHKIMKTAKCTSIYDFSTPCPDDTINTASLYRHVRMGIQE